MKQVLRTVAVRGSDCALQVRQRDGKQPLILYLHGLGCAGSDAELLLAQPQLADYAACLPDLPGHGESKMPNGVRFSFSAVVDVLHQIAGKDDILLIGHSMGGALGLLYAELHPVKLFVNIEGNLAPENCRFSRESKRRTAEAFASEAIPAYLRKLQANGQPSLAQYAKTLAQADPYAVFAMANDLVDLCDGCMLIERYLKLPIPRIYVHGERNRGLSYLATLRAVGLRTIEIPDSGHFPQIENPAPLAEAIGDFLDDSN